MLVGVNSMKKIFKWYSNISPADKKQFLFVVFLAIAMILIMIYSPILMRAWQ
jgi:hypothetical protein